MPRLPNGSVTINLFQSILGTKTFPENARKGFRVVRGVKRHENVWQNASSTIHFPALKAGGVQEAVRQIQAVEGHEFSLGVAFKLLLPVGLHAIIIRLLNATTGGSVVLLDCQSNGTAIWQAHGALNQPLAKAATPHNQASVPILHSARNNFTGAGRGLVNEHNQASLFKQSLVLRVAIFPLKGPALGVDDEFVPTQEFVGHVHGGLQHAAPVALKVQDQILHALSLQLHQGFAEFVHGGFGKTTHLDVACVFIHHVHGVDAVDGDLVSGDVKIQQPTHALPRYAHLNDCSFGAFQQPHDVLVGDANSSHVFPIHFDDAIARANAQSFARPSTDR